MMIKIEYPPYQPRIKAENNVESIFDDLRKKWVTLTPEEWVRQNFLQYLIHVMKYPSSLVAIEKEIRIGELKKRFDIVVYNREFLPWMLIECKEMKIQLSQSVLEQALRYNLNLQANYFVITNGTDCAAYTSENDQLKELASLPLFP